MNEGHEMNELSYLTTNYLNKDGEKCYASNDGYEEWLSETGYGMELSESDSLLRNSDNQIVNIPDLHEQLYSAEISQILRLLNSNPKRRFALFVSSDRTNAEIFTDECSKDIGAPTFLEACQTIDLEAHWRNFVVQGDDSKDPKPLQVEFSLQMGSLEKVNILHQMSEGDSQLVIDINETCLSSDKSLTGCLRSESRDKNEDLALDLESETSSGIDSCSDSDLSFLSESEPSCTDTIDTHDDFSEPENNATVADSSSKVKRDEKERKRKSSARSTSESSASAGGKTDKAEVKYLIKQDIIGKTTRRCHTFITKSNEQPKVKCNLCSEKFLSRDDLSKHRIEKHRQQWLKKCAKCRKLLFSLAEIRWHSQHKLFLQSNPKSTLLNGSPVSKAKIAKTKALNGKTVSRFECKKCGKKFWFLCRLKAHSKTHK